MTKNFSLRTHERKGNCEWHAIHNNKFLGLGQEKEINQEWQNLWGQTEEKAKKLFETAVPEARSLQMTYS